MLAVIATPILFVFAPPLAAGLVLGALLAVSAITFGLSKYVHKKSNPDIPQVIGSKPPQEVSETSAKPLDVQAGLASSLNPQGPSVDPQKKRRHSR